MDVPNRAGCARQVLAGVGVTAVLVILGYLFFICLVGTLVGRFIKVGAGDE